jgi:competence protein ComEC
LEKVKPSIAVIEVGKDNDFGHPNLRIIKRLDRVGAQIFRTDRDGTVKIMSDSSQIKVK